jgi:hypothetical protein
VEILLLIVVGIVALLGVIVLIPVLVIGGWYVVITVLLGLADGAIWLLEQGWRKIRKVQRAPSVGYGNATGGMQPIPVLTAPLAVTSNASFVHRRD